MFPLNEAHTHTHPEEFLIDFKREFKFKIPVNPQ